MELVKNWMTEPVTYVHPEMSIHEANETLKLNRIDQLPVVEDEKVVGIVAKSDLLKEEPREGERIAVMPRVTVQEVMAEDPVCVAPDTPLREVTETMLDARINATPVVSNDKLVGIITKSDIFEAFLEKLKKE